METMHTLVSVHVGSIRIHTSRAELGDMFTMRTDWAVLLHQGSHVGALMLYGLGGGGALGELPHFAERLLCQMLLQGVRAKPPAADLAIA